MESEWKKNDGTMPFNAARVEVQYESGEREIDHASNFDWSLSFSIDFYRIVQWRPVAQETVKVETKSKSDGSTASYYELPENAKELQHLISFKNMNAQIGEIFRACYRYGQVEHSECLRDAKKILFYAKAEIERLEK